MDFGAKGDETVNPALELHASDGWEKLKETAHCTVYSKPTTFFKGHMYKSEGLIPAPVEQVFSCIYPGAENARRHEWDQTAKTEIVEKPFTDLHIIRSTTSPVCMGLISAREFVDLVKVVREPNRIFTAAQSIDHPDFPHKKEFVRGFNYPNSAFCMAHPENSSHTLLIQYLHSDIGGMLPRSLVEGAMVTSAAETYPKIKNLLAKTPKS